MKNSLSRAMAVVDDHAVAVFIEPFLGRDGFCNKEQMSDQFPVGNSDGMNVRNMLFRDDQRMDRRLRIDIFKGDGKVVFMDDTRSDFLLNDPAKDAVRIKAHLLLPSMTPEKLLKKQHRDPV